MSLISCSRLVSGALRRTVVNPTRLLSISSIKKAEVGGGIPTAEEHSTGREKWELEQRKSGNDDPFNLKVNVMEGGTKVAPTVVPSVFDHRIVGCICEEDATTINWMWLYEGNAQRCECGYFFKLERAEAPVIN